MAKKTIEFWKKLLEKAHAEQAALIQSIAVLELDFENFKNQKKPFKSIRVIPNDKTRFLLLRRLNNTHGSFRPTRRNARIEDKVLSRYGFGVNRAKLRRNWQKTRLKFLTKISQNRKRYKKITEKHIPYFLERIEVLSKQSQERNK